MLSSGVGGAGEASRKLSSTTSVSGEEQRQSHNQEASGEREETTAKE